MSSARVSSLYSINPFLSAKSAHLSIKFAMIASQGSAPVKSGRELTPEGPAPRIANVPLSARILSSIGQSSLSNLTAKLFRKNKPAEIRAPHLKWENPPSTHAEMDSALQALDAAKDEVKAL